MLSWTLYDKHGWPTNPCNRRTEVLEYPEDDSAASWTDASWGDKLHPVFWGVEGPLNVSYVVSSRKWELDKWSKVMQLRKWCLAVKRDIERSLFLRLKTRWDVFFEIDESFSIHPRAGSRIRISKRLSRFGSFFFFHLQTAGLWVMGSVVASFNVLLPGSLTARTLNLKIYPRKVFFQLPSFIGYVKLWGCMVCFGVFHVVGPLRSLHEPNRYHLWGHFEGYLSASG